MIRMVKAVVCGGMLAVEKEACSTLTLNPCLREERLVLLPKKSRITVLGDTLKRIAEERFWLRRTRI